MTPPDAETPEPIEQVLRSARPGGSGSEALEKRLAVASIMAASGAERERPRVGRLEVQSRIGGGAMGVVYRAYDPDLQRLVAVKLMRSWTGAEERLQIVEEARRLAQLAHPNVVAVHDIVNDDTGLYFAMEYVAGTTLRTWLDAHSAAGFREVLEWFVQAGRGLSAAHAAAMVHRDFKPENVLVGEDGRVRVADFGLARVLHERGPLDTAGTPYYMAPEVMRGEPATEASDQFGFCIALRDALVGRETPAHIGSAIERGLSPEPAQRHASMAELVQLLTAALAIGGDERPRALLLDRVERLWLRGVLERSLGDGGAANLTLMTAPQLVRPPWGDWRPSDAGEADGDHVSMSARKLRQLLSEGHGSLLLVGPPGSGKTTLLLQLCRELWRTASLNPEAPAPAVLSLSSYRPPERVADDVDATAHFDAWVVDELVVKYGLPRPAVRRWFDEQGIVLLLDGLDETGSSLRGRVVETLNRFRRAHPVSVIVTCRDSEYEALDARLEFGAAVQTQPLDDAAITTLLEERHSPHLLERLSHDEGLRESLRNPLLLTLYASGDDADDVDDSPGWARAYGHYVDSALAATPAKERAELRRQLGWLARAMRTHNMSDLWLERLHFGWLGGGVSTVVAYATGVLAVGVFALGLNLGQMRFTGLPLGTALVFGLAIFLSSFAYTRGRITPVESLRWSGRRALRLLPLTMGIALVISVIEAMKVNFLSNLVGGAITGSIMALLFALEPGERATKVEPNAGIHRSLANALKLSFGAGIPTGLMFAFVLQPHILKPLSVQSEYAGGDPQLIVGVSIGLFVFTAMFLIYGGSSVLLHYALRLWMVWRTPLPADLSGMLGRAAELGLMRRVGGGYVFLHRTLLDYFADRAAADAD